MAEVLALTKILPSIGFEDLVYVAASRKFVPFDLVGSRDGRRILIDVTTGVWKGGHYLQSAIVLADTLGMQLFVLFVKPDLSRFALKPAMRGKGLYCSIRELRPVEGAR